MMNNLNPSSTNQDEDLTTGIGSQKTYELKVFDENEAYRQLEIIQLILYIRKFKKNLSTYHIKKSKIFIRLLIKIYMTLSEELTPITLKIEHVQVLKWTYFARY